MKHALLLAVFTFLYSYGSAQADRSVFVDKIEFPQRCPAAGVESAIKLLLLEKFKQDTRFDSMPPASFRNDDVKCVRFKNGNLIQINYGFGSLASLTNLLYYSLQGISAKPVELTVEMPTLAGIDRFAYPELISVSGEQLIIGLSGYEKENGICCPAFTLTYLYRLDQVTLKPVRMMKKEKN